MFQYFRGLVQLRHHLLCCLERKNVTHLITNQFPFLLVVILPQESGFVWWEVHRILRGKEMKAAD